MQTRQKRFEKRSARAVVFLSVLVLLLLITAVFVSAKTPGVTGKSGSKKLATIDMTQKDSGEPDKTPKPIVGEGSPADIVQPPKEATTVIEDSSGNRYYVDTAGKKVYDGSGDQVGTVTRNRGDGTITFENNQGYPKKAEVKTDAELKAEAAAKEEAADIARSEAVSDELNQQKSDAKALKEDDARVAALERQNIIDSAKTSVTVSGQKYEKKGDNEYVSADGKTTYTLNKDGSVTVENANGKGTLDANSAEAKAMKQNEEAHKAAADLKESEGREGGTRATDKDGKPLSKAKKEEAAQKWEFSWNEVKKQADAAGGWFNFWTGGPFTGSIMTLGAVAGESFPWGGQDGYAALKNSMTINGWAENACRSNLDKKGRRAIITSPSGKSYAHAEGERVYVDPCLGGNYNTSCTPYYSYRISGEVNAGETAMNFNVYLTGDKGQADLYNGTMVELKQGEMLSLSGANMFVWDTYDDFKDVCIKFDGTSDMKVIFGAQFTDDDNPLCQEIVDNKERDYQKFNPKASSSSKPTSKPGAAGKTSTGLSSETPGLKA